MEKYSQITDQTREAFLTAFFELAQKKRISQITIREITNLAGYNRTTFYRYFEDIYALVEYAETDFLQNTRDIIYERCGGQPIGERQFFETMIECFHKNKDRISILLSEENRSHFLRRIGENMTGYRSRFASDSPKKKTIRDIYFYGIFHAISLNLQNEDALPDEDLLDIIQTLFENWYRPEMEKTE